MCLLINQCCVFGPLCPRDQYLHIPLCFSNTVGPRECIFCCSAIAWLAARPWVLSLCPVHPGHPLMVWLIYAPSGVFHPLCSWFSAVWFLPTGRSGVLPCLLWWFHLHHPGPIARLSFSPGLAPHSIPDTGISVSWRPHDVGSHPALWAGSRLTLGGWKSPINCLSLLDAGTIWLTGISMWPLTGFPIGSFPSPRDIYKCHTYASLVRVLFGRPVSWPPFKPR